jgi:hypothetical protein
MYLNIIITKKEKEKRKKEKKKKHIISIEKKVILQSNTDKIQTIE